MKKITLLTILSCVFLPSALLAQDYGLRSTAQNAGLTQYGDSVPTLVGTVIGSALSIIGVIFFILAVYAGFLWMTARGDSDQVSKAKDTLTAAIIGLIIVLGAYAITNFVFESVSGDEGAFTCESDSDCPDGDVCRLDVDDGLKYCYTRDQAPPPEACQADDDCPDNKQCVGDRCVDLDGLPADAPGEGAA